MLRSVFLDGENSLKNPFDIAQKCNDFFVNIGYELANKMSACHGNPLDFIPRYFPIIIDKLKTSSAGHDNITEFLVKKMKQTILQALAHIFSCL